MPLETTSYQTLVAPPEVSLVRLPGDDDDDDDKCGGDDDEEMDADGEAFVDVTLDFPPDMLVAAAPA